jgi:arylsulfatase A
MKHALCFLSIVAIAATAAAGQPNVIVILADDLGYGDLGVYGNKVNRTPNLDRMAREGMRFTDFHTNGANCSPTRAALLTGRYQQRCGIEGALDEGAKGLPQDCTVTIAERLRDAGYATGLMGKWHLGYSPENGPTRHGFDEFVGHLHGATDYVSHVDKYGRMDWWHNEKPVAEQGYNTTLITQHSVRVFRSDLRFCSTSEPGAILFFGRHLACGPGLQRDHWEAVPNHQCRD